MVKPTKKKPAKNKYVADYVNKKRERNPIVTKLLDLKYRINDAYRDGGSSYSNIGDKKWVMGKIDYLRYGDGTVIN